MFRLKEPAIPNELLDQLLAVGAANVAFDRGALLGTLEKAFTKRWITTWPTTTARNLRNSYGRKLVTIYTGKQGSMFCETIFTEEREADGRKLGQRNAVGTVSMFYAMYTGQLPVAT